MTTTNEPHVTLQQPVVVTSNKVNAGPQSIEKPLQEVRARNSVEKEKVSSHQIRGKKNAVKASTSGAVTSAGPSSNLRSKLHDKAKVTTAMIQELTEELQALDQESLDDDQDSEATQESDLEQEDSDNYLTDEEQ